MVGDDRLKSTYNSKLYDYKRLVTKMSALVFAAPAMSTNAHCLCWYLWEWSVSVNGMSRSTSLTKSNHVVLSMYYYYCLYVRLKRFPFLFKIYFEILNICTIPSWNTLNGFLYNQ